MKSSNLVVNGIVVVIMLGILAVCAVVSGWIIIILWNAVIPAIFGLPMLNIWQAIAFSFLVSILISAVRGREL